MYDLLYYRRTRNSQPLLSCNTTTIYVTRNNGISSFYYKSLNRLKEVMDIVNDITLRINEDENVKAIWSFFDIYTDYWYTNRNSQDNFFTLDFIKYIVNNRPQNKQVYYYSELQSIKENEYAAFLSSINSVSIVENQPEEEVSLTKLFNLDNVSGTEILSKLHGNYSNTLSTIDIPSLRNLDHMMGDLIDSSILDDDIIVNPIQAIMPLQPLQPMSVSLMESSNNNTELTQSERSNVDLILTLVRLSNNEQCANNEQQELFNSLLSRNNTNN